MVERVPGFIVYYPPTDSRPAHAVMELPRAPHDASRRFVVCHRRSDGSSPLLSFDMSPTSDFDPTVHMPAAVREIASFVGSAKRRGQSTSQDEDEKTFFKGVIDEGTHKVLNILAMSAESLVREAERLRQDLQLLSGQ